MDIKNPEYILEIARQQSVTRAAQKLFISCAAHVYAVERFVEQGFVFLTGAGNGLAVWLDVQKVAACRQGKGNQKDV